MEAQSRRYEVKLLFKDALRLFIDIEDRESEQSSRDLVDTLPSDEGIRMRLSKHKFYIRRRWKTVVRWFSL